MLRSFRVAGSLASLIAGFNSRACFNGSRHAMRGWTGCRIGDTVQACIGFKPTLAAPNRSARWAPFPAMSFARRKWPGNIHCERSQGKDSADWFAGPGRGRIEGADLCRQRCPVGLRDQLQIGFRCISDFTRRCRAAVRQQRTIRSQIQITLSLGRTVSGRVVRSEEARLSSYSGGTPQSTAYIDSALAAIKQRGRSQAA